MSFALFHSIRLSLLVVEIMVSGRQVAHLQLFSVSSDDNCLFDRVLSASVVTFVFYCVLMVVFIA